MVLADKFDDFASGRRTAFHLIVGIDPYVRPHDRFELLATRTVSYKAIFDVVVVKELYLQDMSEDDLHLFGREEPDLEEYKEAWDMLHPKTPWESNPRVQQIVLRRLNPDDPDVGSS